MANRKFTEQEMLTLRNSKYVLDVSPSIVHFSAEFKKLFWEELSKGRLPREIVSTLGIDPNILGDSRINGLKTMIGNEVKKGNGFRDLNTYAQGCNGYLSAENRIKYLEMQLAYFMSKRKVSVEDKIYAVNRYLDGKESQHGIATMFDVSVLS